MPIPFLQQLQKNPRLPIYLTGLWVLLILFVLWQTLSIFIQSPKTMAPPTTTPVIKPIPPLAAKHLFGIYDKAIANLPLTQLQLTLEGTVVSLDDPNQSHALVSSPSGQTKVYRVGDALPGGATVNKIMKEQIIIEYNGQEQRLRLPVPKLPESDQPQATQSLLEL